MSQNIPCFIFHSKDCSPFILPLFCLHSALIDTSSALVPDSDAMADYSAFDFSLLENAGTAFSADTYPEDPSLEPDQYYTTFPGPDQFYEASRILESEPRTLPHDFQYLAGGNSQSDLSFFSSPSYTIPSYGPNVKSTQFSGASNPQAPPWAIFNAPNGGTNQNSGRWDSPIIQEFVNSETTSSNYSYPSTDGSNTFPQSNPSPSLGPQSYQIESLATNYGPNLTGSGTENNWVGAENHWVGAEPLLNPPQNYNLTNDGASNILSHSSLHIGFPSQSFDHGFETPTAMPNPGFTEFNSWPTLVPIMPRLPSNDTEPNSRGTVSTRALLPAAGPLYAESESNTEVVNPPKERSRKQGAACGLCSEQRVKVRWS
jgi:hypothetical protein